MSDLEILNSHYSSMNRVYEYIDDHIQSDLSLGALSKISGYSESHFHRIFHALTGKTLREYVYERRIYKAASRLLYEDCSITKIAFESGFSSSSSFDRGFQKSFGCSPSSYRKHKARKRPEQLPVYEANQDLDRLFSIVALPDLLVAGIATQGLSNNFESNNIERAFKRLFKWLVKRNLVRQGMPVMGITMDTPEVVPLQECRYFACVPADSSFSSEGEVSIRSFPTNGRYIKFSMERTKPDFVKEFFSVTDYLYGFFMPKLGVFPDNRPFIEMYSQEGAQIVIDFHVPIR